MGVFSRSKFGAGKKLDTISKYIKTPNADENSKIWNYGRYAYISLSTTGTNNAGLCPGAADITLGDSSLTKGASYQSLISRDGDRDIPSKPILESVRIGNDGSTDVSDSALFSIDVSFKCFSASQFKTYEDAYFRVGNGVKLSFGYKGLSDLGSHTMTASVNNFSFSLDASGVYSCNLQLTGKNKFAAVLGINQELASQGTKAEDIEGNVIVAKSIIGELNARFIKTFPDFEEPSFIQVVGKKKDDFVPDGEALHKGGYAIANIQTKGGFDFSTKLLDVDLDDMFVKYVSFKEFVDVINMAHSNSGFEWGFGTKSGKFIDEFASADPSILLLDGEMANYGGDGTAEGVETDDIQNNLQSGIGFKGHAKDMLISIEYIGQLMEDLILKAAMDKESAGDTSINNFLRVLFEKIKDLTGGLYQLTLYNDGFNDSNQFLIVNERAEHAKGATAGYTFSLHNKGSVLKSVSMQSNFDSDMAAAALVSNRSGKVPKGAFNNLYSECDKAVTVADLPITPSLEEVKEKKLELGLGISPERVQDLKDTMASYVTNQPKKTGTDTGYRYMIDLSVTTYGVWGTNIGDTFTFDGLPSKYKGAGKYFCVGKMQHTFDGQGGWEVEYTGFLKLDTKTTT